MRIQPKTKDLASPAKAAPYTESEKFAAANGLDIEYWRRLQRGDHLTDEFLGAIRKGEA